MRKDVQRHLRQTSAALKRFPPKLTDPVRSADELVWKFEKALRDSVESRSFQPPALVGVCRRRLESFVDMLYYHLFPRFCSIPGAGKDGTPPEDLEEFPTALSNITRPDCPDIPVPQVVYLDDLIERSHV